MWLWTKYLRFIYGSGWVGTNPAESLGRHETGWPPGGMNLPPVSGGDGGPPRREPSSFTDAPSYRASSQPRFPVHSLADACFVGGSPVYLQQFPTFIAKYSALPQSFFPFPVPRFLDVHALPLPPPPPAPGSPRPSPRSGLDG